MDVAQTLITIVAGAGGVSLGALLERRNQKKAQAARLLTEALNDALAAIAEVAQGAGEDAQARYASAVSRLALHASPAVVVAFRQFQDQATTVTPDGRARLLAALREARHELGHDPVNDTDIAVLLFGPSGQERERLVN